MTNYYKVRSGDTLWKICKTEYGLTSNVDIANKVNEISKQNNLRSPNSIFVGQTICLTESSSDLKKVNNCVLSTPQQEVVETVVKNADVASPQNEVVCDSVNSSKFVVGESTEFNNISEDSLVNLENSDITNSNNDSKGSYRTNIFIDRYAIVLSQISQKSLNYVGATSISSNKKGVYTIEDFKRDIKNSINLTEDQKALIMQDISNGVYSKEDLEKIKDTKIYSKKEIDDIIVSEAQKYDIDPLIVKALIDAESSYAQFRKNKYSKASGLMQLIPLTADFVECSNVFDAKQNIIAGVKYLSYLKKKFINYDHVLQAYNCGETKYRNVLNGEETLPSETSNYLKKITSNVAKMRNQTTV